MISCGMSGRESRESRGSCRRSCTSEVSMDLSEVIHWLHSTGAPREAAHKICASRHCVLPMSCDLHSSRRHEVHSLAEQAGSSWPCPEVLVCKQRASAGLLCSKELGRSMKGQCMSTLPSCSQTATEHVACPSDWCCLDGKVQTAMLVHVLRMVPEPESKLSTTKSCVPCLQVWTAPVRRCL